MADLDQFAEQQVVIEHLRQANARLSQQLERQKLGQDELVAAVHQAASDAMSGLTIPPVAPPAKDRRTR